MFGVHDNHHDHHHRRINNNRHRPTNNDQARKPVNHWTWHAPSRSRLHNWVIQSRLDYVPLFRTRPYRRVCHLHGPDSDEQVDGDCAGQSSPRGPLSQDDHKPALATINLSRANNQMAAPAT